MDKNLGGKMSIQMCSFCQKYLPEFLEGMEVGMRMMGIGVSVHLYTILYKGAGVVEETDKEGHS